MKKILAILTGIVFVITILVAGGCGKSSTKKVLPEDEAAPKQGITPEDGTSAIYLKDSSINGTMHLFMNDKNNSECGVLDDHLIVVKRNNTVKWKNAPGSNIDEIICIRPVGDSTFFGAVPELETTGVDSTEFFSINEGLYKLVIPKDAPLDTLIKYEILFTVDDDLDTTYTIDPYLKIPKEL